MIDAMARAGFETMVSRMIGGRTDVPVPDWDSQPDALREDWRACAEAMAQVISDPSESAINQGQDVVDSLCDGWVDAERVFKIVLNALLREE